MVISGYSPALNVLIDSSLSYSSGGLLYSINETTPSAQPPVESIPYETPKTTTTLSYAGNATTPPLTTAAPVATGAGNGGPASQALPADMFPNTTVIFNTPEELNQTLALPVHPFDLAKRPAVVEDGKVVLGGAAPSAVPVISSAVPVSSLPVVNATAPVTLSAVSSRVFMNLAV